MNYYYPVMTSFWAQFEKTASRVQHPRLAKADNGSFEEVSSWIDRDLTLKEAGEEHVRLWFGEQARVHPHDMAHVIYAVAIKDMQGQGHHYQGDGRAEVFATTIQAALYSPVPFSPDPADLAMKDRFIALVKKKASLFEDDENYHRALSWLIGKETGESLEAQRVSSGFDINNIIATAQKLDIKADRDWPFPQWRIEAKDGSLYSYDINRSPQFILPTGHNGVEEFEAFVIPPDHEILEVFYRVKPVLDELQPQIADIADRTGISVNDHEAMPLENLKVRSIMRCMDGDLSIPLEIKISLPILPPFSARSPF